jgi:hypothetical protein
MQDSQHNALDCDKAFGILEFKVCALETQHQH